MKKFLFSIVLLSIVGLLFAGCLAENQGISSKEDFVLYLTDRLGVDEDMAEGTADTFYSLDAGGVTKISSVRKDGVLYTIYVVGGDGKTYRLTVDKVWGLGTIYCENTEQWVYAPIE